MSDLLDSKIQVVLKNTPLDITEAVQFVSSPKCGAINTFSGTIRDMDMKDDSESGGQELVPIRAIHYEAYTEMACKQIVGIAKDVLSVGFGSIPVDTNSRIYIGVRLGEVGVEECSIIICISSTGRDFCHRATLETLNRIKSSVAIWKKVIHLDGQSKWAGCCKSEAFWVKK